jgi:hypothetical protein
MLRFSYLEVNQVSTGVHSDKIFTYNNSILTICKGFAAQTSGFRGNDLSSIISTCYCLEQGLATP